MHFLLYRHLAPSLSANRRPERSRFSLRGKSGAKQPRRARAAGSNRSRIDTHRTRVRRIGRGTYNLARIIHAAPRINITRGNIITIAQLIIAYNLC